MNPTTLRIGIAIFLIAHGWIHYSLTTVPVPQPGSLRTPYWPSWWRQETDEHWLASRMGLSPAAVRTSGWILWVVTVAAFCLAGLGLLGVPVLSSVWQPATLLGSAASLLLLFFYWHPWLVIGVLVNLAAVAAVWQQWPTSLFTR